MTNDDVTYTTRSTSRNSADVVEVIPLAESKNGLARKVLIATVVRNEASPENRLNIRLLYERRSSRATPWAPATHLHLSRLRAGEWVQYTLDSAATAALVTALHHLDAIAEHGPKYGDVSWRLVSPNALVVTGQEGELLSRLLKQREREELFKLLSETPDLSDFLAERRLQQVRRDAVRTFERELRARRWDEATWQAFFMNNDWMFGLGLTYQFLSAIQESRPAYGRTDYTGAGAIQGDVLARTGGNTSFTALVELKLPSADLVTAKKYRNHVNELGHDLVHGVAQLHAQCDSWGVAARERDNVRALEARGILTANPKGVLLIGHTESFEGDPDRALVFERYRRSLANPEVITYDELLVRARYLAFGSVDAVTEV
ncbi:MAG: Shedu immune nuclease family protein [Dehalococcoidia bacterium]